MNEPNIADSGPWSLGTLIWLPTLVLLVIAITLLALWLHRYAAAHDREPEAKWAAWACWTTIVLLLVGTASPWGMYPYKAEYHQFRDVSGTVERIDSRLIGGGDKSTETKFVVRFEGSGLQYGCDDTRCAGVEAGDQLTLSCKRAWQYTGTDGYDCRFTSVEAKS